MHGNPIQIGFWHIQFDTVTVGFNGAEGTCRKRAWLTNDALSQWEEAFNDEKTIDNQAVDL